MRSLYVNLHEEDQVDLIMKNLPELEFLNGLPVDRETISDENDVDQSITQRSVAQPSIAEADEEEEDPNEDNVELEPEDTNFNASRLSVQN